MFVLSHVVQSQVLDWRLWEANGRELVSGDSVQTAQSSARQTGVHFAREIALEESPRGKLWLGWRSNWMSWEDC